MIENTYLDKYRETWKKQTSFADPEFTDADLKLFLKGRSLRINQIFKTGIAFDIVLKVILSLASAGLLFLYSGNTGVTVLSSCLIAVIFIMIGYQAGIYRKIPQRLSDTDSIRITLEKKINFYRKSYIKSIYTGSLSNPVLLISGSLYYFYYKYGEIRQLDVDDLLVLGTLVLISFILSAYVQIWYHNFHIRQIEECLEQIDEETLTDSAMRIQKRRRIIILISSILALILGILILIFIILH